MGSDTATPRIVVYGAGGHGKVVAEVVRALGLELLGFVDDFQPVGTRLLGSAVLAPGAGLAGLGATQVALALGDNRKRAAQAERVIAAGLAVGTFVHPRAWVSPTASLGPGTVVMAGAVVNAEARVGAGVILNTGCVVEHECVVGDYAHLSPNSALGGRARVGARAHVGLGASILPSAEVGDDCVVGAGAVVLERAERGAVVVGVPARRLR